MRIARSIAGAVFLVLLCTCGSSQAQNFGKGAEAFNRKDYTTALKEWLPLAEGGDAKVQYLIGHMYLVGDGVAANPSQALPWFRKSAASGNTSAQFWIGMLYLSGQGVPKDSDEGVRWIRQSAAGGNSTAEVTLANFNANGYLIPRNEEDAAGWYRKASDQGNAHAQLYLGMMYQDGRGVVRDYGQAAEWYRKAANPSTTDAQGNLVFSSDWDKRYTTGNAEHLLGVIYRLGLGTEKDDYAAANWLRKAALHGIAAAENDLGELYEGGSGVPQDYVQAHMWFNLAVAHCIPGETDTRNRATANRDRVAEKMTLAQIAEAQRLASQQNIPQAWLTSN